MSTLIKNGLILTQDAQRNVIANGAIYIEKNLIKDIGSTKELVDKYKPDQEIDASNQLVLPGFICTHTHMPYIVGHNMPVDMTQFHSFIEMLTDWAWPQLEDMITKEYIYNASRFASARMLRSGTTTINEMVEAPNDLTGCLDETARALSETGMRAVVAFEATERMSKENASDGIKENLRFVTKHANGDGLIQGRFGCHTCFTCSPEMLQEVRELANKHKAGIHIHVAESTYEVDYIKEKYNKRPIEHMHDLGFLGPDVLAAHCIHLSDNELKLMKEDGVKVSHTPMSNMLGACGVAKIPQMLDQGMTVSLGHDCFFTLDIYEYIRAAFLLHKIANLNPLLIAPFHVLDMVTIEGARALNLEQEIGSLEPGKKADIVLLKQRFPTPPAPNYFGLSSILVNDVNGADVSTVFVDGKIVVENGQNTTIDQEEVNTKVRDNTTDLWKRNNLIPR